MPFLVLGTPIVRVRGRASFFVDTWPKLVQLGIPTPDFESGVSDRKTKRKWDSIAGFSGSIIEQVLKYFWCQFPLIPYIFWAYFLQFFCQFCELPDILLTHSSFDIHLLHYSYFWHLLMSHTFLGKPLMVSFPSACQFPFISPSSLHSEHLYICNQTFMKVIIWLISVFSI